MPAQEWSFGQLVEGEAFEDRFEGVEHRHGPVYTAFGLLHDEAALAGVMLASDPHDVVLPVDVPDLEAGDF
nr:hypothetical protein [Micrococcus terreus]